MKKLFLTLLIGIFMVSCVSAFDWNTDIVSYWQLDETSGTTAEDILGSNNGTTTGATVNQSGKIETAYVFDGSGDYISLGQPENLNFTSQSFSINSWFKTSDTSSEMLLLQRGWLPGVTGLQYAIYFGTDNKIAFRITNSSGGERVDTATGYRDNAWHLVTATYNSVDGNMSIYIDGEIENSTIITGNIISVAQDMRIGALSNNAGSFDGTIDEIGIWNKLLTQDEITELYNSGDGLTYGKSGVVIAINSPEDSLISLNTSIKFNTTITSDNDIVNVSLLINDTIVSTNTSGLQGNYIFDYDVDVGQYNWSIEAYNNESFSYSSITRTFNIVNHIINSETHNSSSYETASETFKIDISKRKPVSSIKLVYNGTEYTTTLSGNYSKTIDIPSSAIGNTSYYYKITYSDATTENTDLYYQDVEAINLTYCTTGTPYINFTFKDEADDSVINATIPTSTLNYYLGSGDTYKTLTYINATAHYSYAFCFTPDTETLNLDYRMQYQSTDYPQRTSEPDTFTVNSTTTDKVLYLLNTVDGIYVTFQVINTADILISGVDVTATREIASEDVVVATGTTGASGSVTFWLNPDFEHDFSFTKAGYTTYEYSDTPTQTSYTITLSSGDTTTNSSFEGMLFSFRPTDTYLINDTEYTFAFNMTSSVYDVTDYGFSLRLANGTEIDAGSTGDEGTEITLNYNVGNQSVIYMDYYWTVNGNTTSRTTSWIVFNSENTDWSLSNFFDDLDTYLDSGIFGLDNFGRNLIVFLILFISVGIMSFKYGFTSPMSITSMIFGIILFMDVLTPIMPDVAGMANLPTFLAGLMLALVIFNEVRLK